MSKSFAVFFLAAVTVAGVLAAYFLHVPSRSVVVITPSPTQETPPAPKIKILLVPGHDLIDVGTTYKNITEESVARKLASYLHDDLSKDERFVVTYTRDFDTGEYVPAFQSYFDSQREAIEQFKTSLKKEMKDKLKSGEVVKNEVVVHNNTSERVGNILYGINMWANDLGVDLALHIHLNNYSRKSMIRPGAYSGYALYVPEHQYAIATSSLEIARAIERRLHEFLHPSTLPVEKDTIIESQQLIAVGANNSRTTPSLLIEYGYIYEPELSNDEDLQRIADLTYEGIRDYYFPEEVKGVLIRPPLVKPLSNTAGVIEFLKNSIPKRVSVNVSAAAYVAANLDTGEILLQGKKDTALPIASVSKLVTALVASKYLDQNKLVTVSSGAVSTEGVFGSLRTGEKMKVGILLYPLLMESSNDAGEALAEAYGRNQFIALMNKEVKAIGAAKTHFDDPTGLSEKNVSSPEDLVRIAHYISTKYPQIFAITRLHTYAVKGHLWKNPTHFLGMKTYIGGKNGFTFDAQNTAVSLFSLKGKTKSANVAIALLKSSNRDKDILTIIQHLDLDRGVVQ